MPTLTIDVFKESEKIETMTLQGKNVYVFGRHPKCDVPLLHESISREHACLVADEQHGCMLIDLGSRSGTTLASNPLVEHVGTAISSGNEISFGASTRTYKVVSINFATLKRSLHDRQRQFEHEISEIN
jgi:dual specificity MAP kinase phosphatase